MQRIQFEISNMSGSFWSTIGIANINLTDIDMFEVGEIVDSQTPCVFMLQVFKDLQNHASENT